MRTKARDLRQLTVKELGEKAASMEEELFNLRFQASMGQLSNPLRLRIVRKDAARVKTVLGEKIRQEKAAAPAGAPKDAPGVAPKVAPKPAPKAAAKDAPGVAPKDATKVAAKKVPKKVAKKAAKKTTKETKK
jgi:large subunit ribosomal protein L29